MSSTARVVSENFRTSFRFLFKYVEASKKCEHKHQSLNVVASSSFLYPDFTSRLRSVICYILGALNDSNRKVI